MHQLSCKQNLQARMEMHQLPQRLHPLQSWRSQQPVNKSLLWSNLLSTWKLSSRTLNREQQLPPLAIPEPQLPLLSMTIPQLLQAVTGA
jgi:hypothetical protein